EPPRGSLSAGLRMRPSQAPPSAESGFTPKPKAHPPRGRSVTPKPQAPLPMLEDDPFEIGPGSLADVGLAPKAPPQPTFDPTPPPPSAPKRPPQPVFATSPPPQPLHDVRPSPQPEVRAAAQPLPDADFAIKSARSQAAFAGRPRPAGYSSQVDPAASEPGPR